MYKRLKILHQTFEFNPKYIFPATSNGNKARNRLNFLKNDSAKFNKDKKSRISGFIFNKNYNWKYLLGSSFFILQIL